jgi:hypothetical protein
VKQVSGDEDDEERKRRSTSRDSVDLEEQAPLHSATTENHHEEQLDRGARRIGGLLADGRIDRHEAVYLIQRLDNQLVVEQNMQAEGNAADRHEKVEAFASGALGRELGPAPEQQPTVLLEVRPTMLSDKQIDAFATDHLQKLADQSKTFSRQKDRLVALGIDPAADAGKAAGAQSAREEADGHITEAGARYRDAHEHHYKENSPHTMRLAANAEYASFKKDLAQLNAAIKKEDDVVQRIALEDEKQIVAREYIALTGARIAHNAEIIWGSEQAVEARIYGDRAKDMQERAEALRKEYREAHAAQEAADENRRGREVQVESGGGVETTRAGDAPRQETTGSSDPGPAEKTDRIQREEGRAGAGDEPAAASAPKPRGQSQSKGLSY